MELLTLAPVAGRGASRLGTAANAPDASGDSGSHLSGEIAGNVPHDSLEERCQLVGADFGLSSREIAVMELIARGYTGPAIAEKLFISENTMRTHNKRIYTKLDIRKKTELLQLIESYLPA